MYTVARFTSSNTASQMLDRVGAELNAVIPGAYSGLRHAGDGFAYDLSSADSWREHQGAILNFIRVGHLVISKALQKQLDVDIDIAIEPEDLHGTNIFCIYVDPEITSALAKVGVGFTVSIYGGGDSGNSL